MTSEGYYQQGRIALTSGDLASAQRHFAQSLLQDPTYIDALNGLAAILTVQGRYQESLHLLQQAAGRAPDDPMYQRNVARVENLIRRSEGEFTPRQTVSASATVEPSIASIRTVPSSISAGRGFPVSASAMPAERATGVGVASVVEVARNVYSLQTPTMPPETTFSPVVVTAVQTPSPSRMPAVSAPPAAGLPRARRPEGEASIPSSSQAVLSVAPSRPSVTPRADGRVVPTGSLAAISYSVTAMAQVRLMITNGMGREGWAQRQADLLAAEGMRAARITNYRHYQVQQTVILFREGQRAEAERIQAALPFAAGVIAAGDLPHGIDVQLLLGNDSQMATGRQAA